MKDSEPRTTPPIPPRRLKRKNKPLVTPTDGVAEAATTSVIRLEQRPRLPPPPPPQRVLPRRGIRPELSPPPDVAVNISPAIYSAENCHSQSITGDKLLASYDDVEEVQPSLSTFGTTVRFPPARGSGKKSSAKETARKKREKAKMPRPNEYPPLFFTLQDFQDVMSDVENSSSRTLKNMTSFEPTPKPRASKIPINDLPGTPKKEEVLFRVTNTNVPFEKSISEWGDVRNDPNHFIFEDYVDRRQIPAQRKSQLMNTKLVLFGDDTFDRDDDETISTSRTASRVRFQVDSPTGDEDAEKITEMDSLQNIDSLPLDFSPSQESTAGEKPRRYEDEDEEEDEFGDVPFDSLLNASSNPPSLLCVDPSEDSTSSKTDFQTILVTATVEPVPLVQGVEKKPFENRGVGDSSVESLGEKSAPFFNEKVILSDERLLDEPKSPCFEPPDLDVKFENEKTSAAPELSHERDKGMETIDRREEKRKIGVDEPLREFTEVENPADKSASENVRRNSFLMDMLQGDQPDERIICKVVAAHPKTPIHGSRVDAGREGGEPSAAVEAKSKLLGELSSSFSAIRLKPVNNVGEVEEKESGSDLKVDSSKVVEEEAVGEVGNRKDKNKDDDNDDDDDDDDDGDEEEVGNDEKYKLRNHNLDSVLDSNVVKCKVSEEPIEESRESRNEPRDRSNVCSQKTDEIIDKKYVESITNIACEEVEIKIVGEKDTKINGDINKKNENAEKSNDNNDDDNDGENHSGINMKKNNNKNVVELASRSSVDKCAIVLKCNNNNDNNAMTPVDVSYDQSQKNNVSIIPGSVRSFVKFYEIQGETNVGLSSNDAAAVPKIKVEAAENASDNISGIINSKNKISNTNSGLEIENDIKYTIVARKPVIQKQRQKHLVNQRRDKSGKSNGPISNETELNESRSIPVNLAKTDAETERLFHSGSTRVRSTCVLQNEQEESRTKQGTESKFKSSAIKKVNPVTSSTHNAASGIARGTQDGSTAAGIKDVVRSGTTNHSVPKSSTSTINEQYTFYCTV